MGWTDEPMVGFDTETTGTDPRRDRIVTAAIVRSHRGEMTTRQWLIDPGVPIPQPASAIHGVTTAQAQADGADPREALEEIAAELHGALSQMVPVVAFNACFDLTLLECELARHDLPTLTQRLGFPIKPIIDPLVVDRAVDRYRKGKRTLSDLCVYYGVVPEAGLHAADVDVLATLGVLARLAEKNPDLGNLDVLQLHEWQEAAHKNWAANFNAYLASRGRTPDVPLTWPL